MMDRHLLSQLLGHRVVLPVGGLGASASDHVERHGLPEAPPQEPMFVSVGPKRTEKSLDAVPVMGKVRVGR